MLKINLIFILFITIAVKLPAQSLELLSHSISQLNPAEAVYLHTDKELYFPHEKVWFKAYVRSEYLPSGTSTNLFADLLDQNNKIEAGQTLQLPRANWRDRSAGPAGTNKLLVFVADGPRDLSQLGGTKVGPFSSSLNDAEGRAKLGALMSTSRLVTSQACETASNRKNNPLCSDAFGAALVSVEEIK